MAERHRGGCHCGAVRYSAELDLSAPVIECNCSHCSKKGLLLAFIPPGQFTLEQGEDAETQYLFNTHNIRHLFCSACGVEPFARGVNPKGDPMVAINVRSIDGIDLEALNRQPFDGASR